MATEIKKIISRRDTAAKWESNNPILAQGEIGIDTTNRVMKIGDGVTPWKGLPAHSGELAQEGGSSEHKVMSQKVTTEWLTMLDECLMGGIVDLSTLVYNNGYIHVNGVVAAEAGFYHTNPLKVYKGDIVSITTNTTPLVSLVSVVNADGTYTSVLSGNGSATYTWVADKDCAIVISTIRKVGEITRQSVRGILDELSEDVEGIELEIRGDVVDALDAGVVDQAWRVDGVLGYAGSFSHCNPIKVSTGDLVLIDGAVATEIISVVTRVDGDGNYLSTIVAGKSGVGSYAYTCAFDGYISVSSSAGSFKRGMCTVKRLGIADKLGVTGKSLWQGKRIMAIGDSLTASTSAANWQYVMGDILGCSIRTHAKGGIGLIAMVDGDGDEKPEADPDNFGVEEIYPLEDSDVEDVDLLVVFGAYNEYNRALNNYGTMGDMYPARDTLLGRLRYVAKRLTDLTLSANKECRVAFVSTYCFGGGSYCNSTGYEAGERILDAFKEVGKEFSIPVIDLLHEGQISKYNWDTFCSGAGKENTTYLPYDASVPYGTPSIFPSTDALPSSARDGVIALIASTNAYGYSYSQFKDGAWVHGIYPWSSGSYPPYVYLWKDFVHLNPDGHNRVAQFVAKQVNAL